MTSHHHPTTREISRAARVSGVLLLVLLPVIAGWVVIAGASGDPVREGLVSPEKIAAEQDCAVAAHAAKPIPAALVPALPADAPYRAEKPAWYDAESVYEKINGAAPEFIERGFRALLTCEFIPKDPEWFGAELYVYDQGSPEGAKSMYDFERGDAEQHEEFGVPGYTVEASVYLHVGPYYVIVLNTDQGEAAVRFSTAVARAVVAAAKKEAKP